MPLSFALTSVVFPENIFFSCKFFIKFSVFEVDKFLQTLMRLEKLAGKASWGTWQADGRNLVWFVK
jgi:hypothetical protein